MRSYWTVYLVCLFLSLCATAGTDKWLFGHYGDSVVAFVHVASCFITTLVALLVSLSRIRIRSYRIAVAAILAALSLPLSHVIIYAL